MKGLLSSLRQSLLRGMVIAFVGLLSWVGMSAISANAIAAPTVDDVSGQQEVISPDSQKYGSREEAYDKAVQAIKDPKGAEKEYEKDLKIFKKETPNADKVIENTAKAVKKTVGQE
ncbi:MAG: hypothetical protein KME43_02965 [Myxacorys chilensis ATA2-1-KO14]|jgi:hypothetical protein|nr:hypothetical protein [Myxacorys chilensis ATA2-1-KO14]